MIKRIVRASSAHQSATVAAAVDEYRGTSLRRLSVQGEHANNSDKTALSAAVYTPTSTRL